MIDLWMAELVIGVLGVALVGWWVLRHRPALARHDPGDVPMGDVEPPPTLHPVIDPDRCIGSAACAAACPEGDVLRVRDGRAYLADPGACIGHGRCAAECPVQAITLVFGTATRGVDIPHVTEHFETNVPGLYIVGELGGMGLIRNAVTQGVQAVAHIARQERSDDPEVLDVLVAGAGPAGIAAALEAHRRGLRCRIVEQDQPGGAINQYPRRKLVMLSPMTIPTWGKVRAREMRKEELAAIFDEAMQRAGVEVLTGARLVDARRQGDIFVVDTTRGTFRTRHVVLAIGRRGTPRRLDVPGDTLSKVTYALREPEAFAGLRVLVVGGGDSAVEAAVMLGQVPGTTVHLAYRRARLTRPRPANRQRIEQAVAAGRVHLRLGTEVREIRPEAVVLTGPDGEEVLPNDQVVALIGGEPPTALLARLGVAMERKFGTA